MGLDAAAITLRSAGLDEAAIAAWIAAAPNVTATSPRIGAAIRAILESSDALIRRLPRKPARNSTEAEAAQSFLAATRDKRERFLGAHVEALYDELTAQSLAICPPGRIGVCRC